MKFAKQISRSPCNFSNAKQEVYYLSCGILVTDVSLLFYTSSTHNCPTASHKNILVPKASHDTYDWMLFFLISYIMYNFPKETLE